MNKRDIIVSVIIVNYNTENLLIRCLKAITEEIISSHLKGNTEIIIIDNASSDNSIKKTNELFPGVIVINNNKNLGFAKANNQGMQKSRGRYLLLLNSDTQIKKGALNSLISFIDNNSDTGVVGAKLFNTDNSLQTSLGFFPNLFSVFLWMSFLDDIPFLSGIVRPYHVQDNKFYDQEHSVDWVTGACMMVRREVFDKTGGFNEKYFMYGEEVEWCYRIKRAGFQVKYNSQSLVLHEKGGSTTLGADAGIVGEYASIAHFYKIHKPAWQYPVAWLLLTFGALLRIVIFGIIRGQTRKIALYVQAIYLAGR